MRTTGAVARVVAAYFTFVWCGLLSVEGKLGEPRSERADAEAAAAAEAPTPEQTLENSGTQGPLESLGTSESPGNPGSSEASLENSGILESSELPSESAIGEAEPEAPPSLFPRGEEAQDVGAIGEVLSEANFKYSNEGPILDPTAAGGISRDLKLWQALNASSLNLAAGVPRHIWQGHEYLATTTYYADTCCGSCGRLDTARLVQGTDYYAVASAEAMQSHFGLGNCCWCGESSQGCGHGSGTAPMGCTACARGRFLPHRPYSQSAPSTGHHLFQKEFNIVVADICPHKGNEAWCPRHVGVDNHFGSKNHFDFASPPPGFDNFYFAFTPTPCSHEIQNRLGRMSMCNKRWR
mmetsp:Transcript_56125/g.119498  ORF Transcript_56125/g.119498 Transcript_56125/m.119498 type:complete len:352 (+) Transcript_56125:138-1193(+)